MDHVKIHDLARYGQGRHGMAVGHSDDDPVLTLSRTVAAKASDCGWCRGSEPFRHIPRPRQGSCSRILLKQRRIRRHLRKPAHEAACVHRVAAVHVDPNGYHAAGRNMIAVKVFDPVFHLVEPFNRGVHRAAVGDGQVCPVVLIIPVVNPVHILRLAIDRPDADIAHGGDEQMRRVRVADQHLDHGSCARILRYREGHVKHRSLRDEEAAVVCQHGRSAPGKVFIRPDVGGRTGAREEVRLISARALLGKQHRRIPQVDPVAVG